MTTGPVGRPSTSAGCSVRSPTAASRRRSRSADAGSSNGPIPGSTTSASCAAAPNAAVPASTPTSPWPRPSSPSVPCAGPPGTSTAGTPDRDHHASADLLAGALTRVPRVPADPPPGQAEGGGVGGGAPGPGGGGTGEPGAGGRA